MMALMDLSRNKRSNSARRCSTVPAYMWYLFNAKGLTTGSKPHWRSTWAARSGAVESPGVLAGDMMAILSPGLSACGAFGFFTAITVSAVITTNNKQEILFIANDE